MGQTADTDPSEVYIGGKKYRTGAVTVEEETNSEQLARARHELRTPLSAVIGYSELLLQDALDLGLHAFVPRLNEIHRAGRRLLNHVKELVQPAAFAAGAGWADLDGRARELLDTILERTAELVAEAPRRAPDMVADLENIRTSCRDIEARVRRLADGGAEAATSPLPASRPAAALEDGDRGAVLVVDDHAINRDLIARHLGREGYRVALADSGRAALEELATADYDLVLLDVMMPDMDGFAVLRRIKDDGGRRQPPVILISALDDMRNAVRGIELGAEDYLPRPFDPLLLKTRVEAAIEKRRLRDRQEAYRRDVAALTAAAAAVEHGELDGAVPGKVAERDDELGDLGRTFRRMTEEIHRREEELKRRIADLAKGSRGGGGSGV